MRLQRMGNDVYDEYEEEDTGGTRLKALIIMGVAAVLLIVAFMLVFFSCGKPVPPASSGENSVPASQAEPAPVSSFLPQESSAPEPEVPSLPVSSAEVPAPASSNYSSSASAATKENTATSNTLTTQEGVVVEEAFVMQESKGQTTAETSNYWVEVAVLQ